MGLGLDPIAYGTSYGDLDGALDTELPFSPHIPDLAAGSAAGSLAVKHHSIQLTLKGTHHADRDRTGYVLALSSTVLRRGAHGSGIEVMRDGDVAHERSIRLRAGQTPQPRKQQIHLRRLNRRVGRPQRYR